MQTHSVLDKLPTIWQLSEVEPALASEVLYDRSLPPSTMLDCKGNRKPVGEEGEGEVTTKGGSQANRREQTGGGGGREGQTHQSQPL